MAIASVRRSLAWTASDIATVTWRNMMRYVRVPDLLVFTTIQPVMFVLLFAYVFGGAISTPGGTYIQYLIPGIIVQAVVFGSTNTAVGLAEDLTKGVIDRFRSLPMARSAVLAGRTLSDTARNLVEVLIMVGVGMAIGFRFQAGLPDALAAMGLTVLFGLALSWAFATLGLMVKSVEAVQTAGFVFVFPFVFVSSIFVPVQSMPGWLQAAANANPITVVSNAVRALALGGPVGDSLWGSLAWIVVILLVFVPVSVAKYRRTV